MALKIRLARGGSKKRPFYRIVVAEAIAPRDGRFIEKLGTYNPLLEQGNKERIVLNKERIQHWLSVGAQPTDRVTQFLEKDGLVKAQPRTELTKKNQPRRKAQERLKAEAATREADAEKAKKEVEAAKAAKTAAAETAAAAAAAPVEAPAEVVAPAQEEAPVETTVEATPAQEEAPAETTVEATPAQEEAPAPVKEEAPVEATPSE